jgi:drug/metabolite transporter (DMT)-like permease
MLLTTPRISAVESSIINNTMLVQIAILAWAFLGEELSWQQIGAMALAGAGALVVQLRGRTPLFKKRRGTTESSELLEHDA